MTQQTNKKPREPRPTKCPKCGSKVLPIVYGYPGAVTRQESIEGKIILGGCSIVEGAPTWRCDGCGHEGGSLSVGD